MKVQLAFPFFGACLLCWLCNAFENVDTLLDSLDIHGGPEVGVRAPRLEKYLKAASREDLIAMLNDSRDILEASGSAGGGESIRFQSEVTEDGMTPALRVKDIVYCVYSSLDVGKDLPGISPDSSWAARDAIIGKLILKLDSDYLHALTVPRTIAFETPFRVVEVLLGGMKRADYALFVATLSGEALSATTTPVAPKEAGGGAGGWFATRDNFMKQALGADDVPEMRFYQKDSRLFAELRIVRRVGKEMTQYILLLRFVNTPVGWRVDSIQKGAEQPAKHE